MINIENSILLYILLFLLTVLALYLKKVLFFEDSTPQTRKCRRFLLAGQILLSVINVLFVLSNKSVMSFNVSLIVYLIYAYINVVINSFICRKERKWFSFFIPIPLGIFALSIYNITQVFYILIKNFVYVNVNSTIILTALFTFFFIAALISRKFPNSPLMKFEKFTEGKSLSFKEEMIVCATTLILLITVIITSLYTLDDLIKATIFVYGFIIAFLIIFMIFNINGKRYYEKQNHKLQITLITTMADLVETRDENTGGHIRRTARYVEIIANELKRERKFTSILTDAYIYYMIIAAPLHDIGKIKVPDSVLIKKGRLESDEYEVMKIHTSAGYDIFKHIEKQTKEIPYIKIAKQMAKSHHEWINGQGYPEGLKDDEIPLCAKILAVADVFDALVSKRCYKEAFPLNEAYEILRAEAGTHLDTDVVNAFFAARKEIEASLLEESM